MFISSQKWQRETKMIFSRPLLSCELSVLVKQNPVIIKKTFNILNQSITDYPPRVFLQSLIIISNIPQNHKCKWFRDVNSISDFLVFSYFLFLSLTQVHHLQFQNLKFLTQNPSNRNVSYGENAVQFSPQQCCGGIS